MLISCGADLLPASFPSRTPKPRTTEPMRNTSDKQCFSTVGGEREREKKTQSVRCSDVINERFCEPLHSDNFHTPYKQGFTADLIYILGTKCDVSMLLSADKLSPANVDFKKGLFKTRLLLEKPPSINFQITDVTPKSSIKSRRQRKRTPRPVKCLLIRCGRSLSRSQKHLWT